MRWLSQYTAMAQGALEALTAMDDPAAESLTLTDPFLGSWFRARHRDRSMDLPRLLWPASLPKGLIVEDDLFLAGCRRTEGRQNAIPSEAGPKTDEEVFHRFGFAPADGVMPPCLPSKYIR